MPTSFASLSSERCCRSCHGSLVWTFYDWKFFLGSWEKFSKSNHNLKKTPHLPNPRVHANIKPFDFESIFHVSSLRQPLCTSAVVRAFGSRGKVFSLLLIRKWRLERRFFFFRWTFSRAQTHPTSLTPRRGKKFSEQSDCETICITISWAFSCTGISNCVMNRKGFSANFSQRVQWFGGLFLHPQ